MQICYKGIQLYYKRAKAGGTPILLLHGFGASSKTVDCLFYFLSNRGFDVTSVDMPGFGQSDEPRDGWTIYEYARCMRFLIEKEGILSPIVVGHSFGGRVGILLGASGVAGGLVLIDSAGLKPKRKPSYYIKIALYKLKKRLGLDVSNCGSKDYKSLTQSMKKTFVLVVNEHLDRYLDKVDCPTLILWGKRDRETPPYMAKRLKRRIKDSGLIMLEGGHYSYIDDYATTCAVLESFVCSF